MKKLRFILPVLLLSLTGCVTSRLKYIDNQVQFAKQNQVLIKEMAEYAVMFCLENNVSEFKSEIIADRIIRNKIAHLGSTIYVTYSNECCHYDSSVTFHTVSIGQGTQEFIYDFATNPRNMGSEKSITKESAFIQTSERVYYKKRPFPMI